VNAAVATKRRIDGVLVLEKPVGLSSNAALQRVKALFAAAKAGHTGSLDPFATGVLPVCLGEATKLSQFLLDADKAYIATLRFGSVTDTGDNTGNILRTTCTRGVNTAAVEEMLQRFLGEQRQVPPMYSALKRNGVPLYVLARQGHNVEREPRVIRVHSLKLLDFVPGESAQATLEVRVSKGTYVRTLAEDIGAALGWGAHLIALHRTATGDFTGADAVSLDDLQRVRESGSLPALDRLLFAPARIVSHLPEVRLDTAGCRALHRGQVTHAAAPAGMVRVVDAQGVFHGIARSDGSGQLRAQRMMREQAQPCVAAVTGIDRAANMRGRDCGGGGDVPPVAY
jgi:tRNA pseudouridine55 synthase